MAPNNSYETVPEEETDNETTLQDVEAGDSCHDQDGTNQAIILMPWP